MNEEIHCKNPVHIIRLSGSELVQSTFKKSENIFLLAATRQI